MQHLHLSATDHDLDDGGDHDEEVPTAKAPEEPTRNDGYTCHSVISEDTVMLELILKNITVQVLYYKRKTKSCEEYTVIYV